MEIRNISFDSYDSLIALWERSGLSYRPEGRDAKEGMKIEFERNPDLLIGAFEDNELIGAIIGTDDGRKGWINRLAVDPNYRKKGVATDLIYALESALKKRGRRIICTLIEDWNENSLSLFKNAGYIKHKDIFYLSKREGDHV
ncbi:MAG: GNAT family N-acetyltransferase [Thermoplasmata archaeon]|nr:MAG: GNAT family N-acetyltransferase [Thermoplasmata archaeon]